MFRFMLAALAALCLAAPASAQVTPFPPAFRIQDIPTNGAVLHVRVGGHGPAVWLRRDNASPRTLQASGESTYSLAFAPDNKLLAVGGGSTGKNARGELWLWDVRTAQSLVPLAGHTAFVAALTFSPDGRLLAAGDGRVADLLAQVANVIHGVVGGRVHLDHVERGGTGD